MEIFFKPTVFFTILTALLLFSFLILFLQARNEKKGEMDLVKAVVEKEALEKKTQELKEALDKMNSQLAVNAQMFEGLKGQYNELERDYEKLNLRLQEKSQKVA